jgi:hypothetical protein
MKRIAAMSVVSVVAAFVGVTLSKLPVFAQAGKVGGTYSILVQASNNAPIAQYGALLTPDGGMVASVAPHSCFVEKTSVGLAFGSWTLKPGAGGLEAQFHTMGPVYVGGENIGEIRMYGSFPLTPGVQLAGRGTLEIPEGSGCELYSGPVTFLATAIPSTPPKPRD